MYNLIKFEDGKCDFNANGFDCRDCPQCYSCEMSEIEKYEADNVWPKENNNINNGAGNAPQNF